MTDLFEGKVATEKYARGSSSVKSDFLICSNLYSICICNAYRNFHSNCIFHAYKFEK
jgi:hypothetical protein